MGIQRTAKIYRTIATKGDIEKSSSWDTMEFEESVFPWKYDTDETCIILEGRAIVNELDGEEVLIQKGDKVHFRKGTVCGWKVVKKLRKSYILHHQ